MWTDPRIEMCECDLRSIYAAGVKLSLTRRDVIHLRLFKLGSSLTSSARPFFNTILKERRTMSNENTNNTAQNDNQPKGTGQMCPKCGKELQLRDGKRGPFLGCSGFPKCRYTADLSTAPKDEASAEAEALSCPACQTPMRLRSGSRGEFWSCPKCRKTVDAEGLAKAEGAKCPDCGAPMVVRKGKKGEFLGCSRFPECRSTAQLGGSEAEDVATEDAPAGAAAA